MSSCCSYQNGIFSICFASKSTTHTFVTNVHSPYSLRYRNLNYLKGYKLNTQTIRRKMVRCIFDLCNRNHNRAITRPPTNQILFQLKLMAFTWLIQMVIIQLESHAIIQSTAILRNNFWQSHTWTFNKSCKTPLWFSVARSKETTIFSVTE